MKLRRYLLGCPLAAVAALCATCYIYPSKPERIDKAVDCVKVLVVNKGPDVLYEVKVRVGDEGFNLGSFAPGLVASRKIFPNTRLIGKSVTVVVEYEDEEGEVVRLEGSKVFEVFAKGEIRLEIGNGKLLAEKISTE